MRYLVGILVLLLSTAAAVPVFLTPADVDHPRVLANLSPNTPEPVTIDRPGRYAIFVPGWDDDRRTARLGCTVTTQPGTAVAQDSPPRTDLLLDYDDSFLRWAATFTVNAPGPYTVRCDSTAETDYFQVTAAPAWPRWWTVLAERVAVSVGLAMGVAFLLPDRVGRRDPRRA